MKSYVYYPGCSLTGTAKEYDLSVRALMAALGAGLVDIDDWTCCGATAAQAVDTRIAMALCGRNLALARKTAPETGRPQVLVPCSACYLNLLDAQKHIDAEPGTRQMVDHALAGEGLRVSVDMDVRHLLDVLSQDFEWDNDMFLPDHGDRSNVHADGSAPGPGAGLVVAPYYGCQCLRPYPVFDDPEQPHAMDAMIRATGAKVLDWDMGARCCGASNATTKPEAGRILVAHILDGAQAADCIVTVCPMCQMNLETCNSGRDRTIPVLYLPQFLGWAMGLSRRNLGLDLNLTDNMMLISGS